MGGRALEVSVIHLHQLHGARQRLQEGGDCFTHINTTSSRLRPLPRRECLRPHVGRKRPVGFLPWFCVIIEAAAQGGEGKRSFLLLHKGSREYDTASKPLNP